MVSRIVSRRWCLCGLTLVALGALAAIQASGGPDEPKPVHAVRLIVDYGDGVQKHFTAIAWRKDMTVFDAMSQAKASPHGIMFQHTGSGSTAFLTRIDDLQNQGGGSGKHNWLFWVNTKLGDKSFGEYKLEPSDVVMWKFSAQKLNQ